MAMDPSVDADLEVVNAKIARLEARYATLLARVELLEAPKPVSVIVVGSTDEDGA